MEYSDRTYSRLKSEVPAEIITQQAKENIYIYIYIYTFFKEKTKDRLF